MKACFASEMRGVDKAASEIGGIPTIMSYERTIYFKSSISEMAFKFP